VPQEYPLSFSMVRLHVVFGLPLFLLPPCVHLRATFVMSSDGLRRTWPSPSLLNQTKSPCPWCLWCYAGHCWRFLFGQNICIIFLRLVSLSVLLYGSETL
jgi:hypothetical protein